jgi:2-polyprenyl-3-methyl-5-hydroxy-6-metoxy-1,4-benzoquinol methylase
LNDSEGGFLVGVVDLDFNGIASSCQATHDPHGMSMWARIPVVTSNPSDETDPANGWESVAETFIRRTARSITTGVGVTTVRFWARSLPHGGAILDLGCGPGGPRTGVLVESGFAVHAIDASPSLAREFQSRFPGIRVACARVEDSQFFGQAFDAAMAWGLLFLLPEESQQNVIHRVARVLKPAGRFLFTAPARVCTWADATTGRASWSLGAEAYKAELARAGLTVVGEYEDEGENHYYDAVKQ